MKRFIYKQMVPLCFVLTVCMTGCSKEDDLLSELNSEGTVQVASDVEEKKPGSAALSYNVEIGSNGKMVKVNVDSIDISEDFGSAFDAEIMEHTDEEMDKLATSIFDNGEYEIIKSPFSGTHVEADDLKNRMEEELEEYAQNNPDLTVNEDTVGWACGYMSLYSGMVWDSKPYAEEPTEEGKIYYTNGKGSSEIIGMVRGKIDGEDWLITDTYDSDNMVDNPTELVIERMLYIDEKERRIQPSGNLIDPDSPDAPEHELDYDDSLKQAREMLDKLGFTNYSEAVCYDVISVNETDYSAGGAHPSVGYYFGFVPEINAAKGAYSDSTVTVVCENGEKRYMTTQKYAMVLVLENGVVSISLGDAGKVGEEIESGIELISLEEADEVFRNNIAEYVKRSINVVSVEIGYVTVDYPEGAAFVPAYVYYTDGKSTGYIWQAKRAIAAVNALNGEFIYYDSPMAN